MSDSENVDPALMGSSTKRQKNISSEQGSYKPANGFHLVTKPQSNGTPVKTPTEESLFSAPTWMATPKSAPLRAPAGRSPKSRVSKAFSRRSLGARSRPRSTPTQRCASRAPFSISDALNGTFSAAQAKATGFSVPSGVHHKKSWDFEIYVDTEQEEMANLMEHSTCTLDISDDEGRGALKDDRGKENIPPNEVSGTHQSSAGMSRADEMTDEARTPLGELNPKNYVPEGVDASDSVLVPEDDQEADAVSKKTACSPLSATETATADEQPNTLPEQPQLVSETVIKDLISNSGPPPKDDGMTPPGLDSTTSTSGTDFDIWESGSATEEVSADPAPETC